MIEVKNLTKIYDGNMAVDHLDFTLEEGKIYGFLGPNGAGKSTTMNMITGYLAPTEGTVTINGHDILEDAEEARKCMGYLPEFPPLYMDMTVSEYMSFAAELKKIAKNKREDAIVEAMKAAGADVVSERLIKNLSKGYKQRVGLAMAILGFPDIIILDEPTVGLDPIQIIEMRETIRSLSKGHTVLLSSHILSEVAELCDHIIIISQGKLVASDTPENLSRNLANETTLRFSVKDPDNKLPQVIRELKNAVTLKSARLSRKDASDIASAELTYAPDEEIRDELFLQLCDAGLPVYSMQADSRSLEDIFIELTHAQEQLDLKTKETRKILFNPFRKKINAEEKEDNNASDL